MKILKKNDMGNSQAADKKKTAQQWMPIVDINAGAVIQKNNEFTVALRLYPVNIDLLSDNELAKIISICHEAINGLNMSFQTISMGRPVDLDEHLNKLDEKMRSTDDPIRKQLSAGYLRQASEMARSGNTLERRFYLIIKGQQEKKAREELKNKAMEIASNLIPCGLGAELLNDVELMDMHFCFSHPGQAAIERVPETTGPYLPPTYGG